ncbi:MAG: DUF4007 family protein [Treponema sp.]|nr:DUF4007 family protein [Treponema sp.]
MKYSGHESFSIRKNWLQKGIRKIDSFKKSDMEAMDETGLGRNMVKSLRYWLKAVGITEDEPKKKLFSLSDFGKTVAERDPYIQEMGTLFLLQYNLATNKDYATSWYFLFNEFNMTEFSEEDFCKSLQNWDGMNNEKKAASSAFQKDFDCIRRTYTQAKGEDDPESNMGCPFSELGLLRVNDNGELQKTSPLKKAFPPIVLYACILKQCGNASTEIRLSRLQNDTGSVGKAFNMDSILLMSLLGELENKNLLQVVRTAGLDVVRLKTAMTFEEAVEFYYDQLGSE